MAIDRASIRAYVARDWAASRTLKREYWRDRLIRGGLAEAIEITEQLRQWMKRTNPSWPTKKDREEDFETHQRVADALAKTSPGARAPRKRTARIRRARKKAAR